MSDSTPSPAPNAPLSLITDTDRRGVIVVVSAVTLSFLLVCFAVRVHVRLRVSGPWSHDDYSLSVATFFGVLQSIAVFLQVSKGFGVAADLLSNEDIATIGKINYANILLYLVTLYLSKIAAVSLILRLTSNRRHLIACWGSIAASTVWAISSILLVTIRCNPAGPLVDLNAQCSGLFARWQYVCALDVVTELAVFAIAIYLVSGLQMPLGTKAMVVLAFALRLPVIAAAAVRLHYLHRQIYSPDPSLAGVLVAVWTQIEENYGLIATAAACLGPFIRPFSRPYLTHTQYAQPGTKLRGDGGGYKLSNFSSGGYSKSNTANDPQGLATQNSVNDSGNQLQQSSRNGLVPHDRRGNGRQSLDSHDSKRMIITKGVEWVVEYEDASDDNGKVLPSKTDQRTDA